MFRHCMILFFGTILLCCVLTSQSIAQESIRYGDRIVVFGNSDNDLNLKKKYDKWYRKQIAQDCNGTLKNSTSIILVQGALKGNKEQYIHGPKDPFNRRDNVKYLLSRNNPLGEGALVHGWIDINKRGFADYHRKRFVWLVLDKKIYPLHVYASGALSRLYDGLPSSIEKGAGLKEPKKDNSYLDQIGLEADSFIRFQAGRGGNPFPLCISEQ